ncbi:MAG: 50S ribosomal protein L18 [Candidatus Nealsonbacteria bacterium]
MLKKQEKRIRRHKRVRAKVKGTAEIPRFYVFRTSKHIYAQLINDDKGKTLLSFNDVKISSSKKSVSNSLSSDADKGKETQTKKIAIAYQVGESIAKKALENKIEKVVFDRGGYKYHGRVKAVAEGARKAGLKF